jgi:hypothetical protein
MKFMVTVHAQIIRVLEILNKHVYFFFSNNGNKYLRIIYRGILIFT